MQVFVCSLVFILVFFLTFSFHWFSFLAPLAFVISPRHPTTRFFSFCLYSLLYVVILRRPNLFSVVRYMRHFQQDLKHVLVLFDLI